jgi:hypothetical protein
VPTVPLPLIDNVAKPFVAVEINDNKGVVDALVNGDAIFAVTTGLELLLFTVSDVTADGGVGRIIPVVGMLTVTAPVEAETAIWFAVPVRDDTPVPGGAVHVPSARKKFAVPPPEAGTTPDAPELNVLIVRTTAPVVGDATIGAVPVTDVTPPFDAVAAFPEMLIPHVPVAPVPLIVGAPIAAGVIAVLDAAVTNPLAFTVNVATFEAEPYVPATTPLAASVTGIVLPPPPGLDPVASPLNETT